MKIIERLDILHNIAPRIVIFMTLSLNHALLLHVYRETRGNC